MRVWTPKAIYDARPWFFVAVGATLAVGTMVWSLVPGPWSLVPGRRRMTLWRSILCIAGAAMAIVGGAALQLRQDYRARSLWRR